MKLHALSIKGEELALSCTGAPPNHLYFEVLFSTGRSSYPPSFQSLWCYPGMLTLLVGRRAWYPSHVERLPRELYTK